MHLVLGSERVDLSDRVLVIGRFADASTAEDVHRLADAGAVAVGLTEPAPALTSAAAERGLAVLVPAGWRVDVEPERLLVRSAVPVDGGVACLDLEETGPAAWGRATVALAAGVRVVRTDEPRSIRRVAAVVERLTAAGAVS